MAAPRALASSIMADDDVAVLGIEAGGGFVQQQDRMAADEAAGEVDALLLAAGEGGRRQGVQAGGEVEPVQQGGRPGAGLVGRGAARPRLGDDVERGTRGMTRRNWLT